MTGIYASKISYILNTGSEFIHRGKVFDKLYLLHDRLVASSDKADFKIRSDLDLYNSSTHPVILEVRSVI